MTKPIYISEEHREQLAASAISEPVIAERGYRTVTRKEDLQGFERQQMRVPGLLIPVYRLGRPEPYTHMLRPDRPRQPGGKTIKYEWPMSVNLVLDVLPRYRSALGDPSVPLWFTEGAKKADALASHFGDAVMPVNLNGVWGWRGKNGQGGKTSLPDFEEIAFNGREVVLAFDSDVVRKEQVKLALERLAAFLASRGAHVRVLYLPEPGGRKLGVDDALAAGYNPLEYLQTPQGHEARGPLGTHPLTGQKLFLPEGYSLEQGGLYRMVGDKPRPVYPGHLAVTALGSDLDTGDETLTVAFDRGLDSHTTVTAPRAELAKAKGVLEYLAARGAAVSEVNAKEVAAYLVAFAHHNRTALPHESRASRLGLYRRGSTLVLPDGAVGDIHTAVKPEPAVRVGKDLGAYRRVLEEASGWEDAGAFWTALGLALAAPAIVRAGVRRNPVLYLAGDSGTGKSTLAQFAVGVWGDPTHSPLRLEAGRTTLAGYLQTLERLGGLPLFIDEAHTAREQDNPLEKLVYQFANGESYTRGGADGRARGGTSIGGALLLAGEALPAFRHHGAHRRVLWLEGPHWMPLGRRDAGERAALLEAAWGAGAGTLGRLVSERVWLNWEDYRGSQPQFAQSFTYLPAPWNDVFAHVMVTLGYACGALELPYPDSFRDLPVQWQGLLSSAASLRDPSSEAWEDLSGLIAAAGPDGSGGRRLKGEVVAWEGEYQGQKVWFVPTGTGAFTERMGKTAVQLHGQRWAERGLILPGSDGKATIPRKRDGLSVRVLAVVQRSYDE